MDVARIKIITSHAMQRTGALMVMLLIANLQKCVQNPIYVFSEKELGGLSPNSYNHVSVSDLYIPRICPHIWLQQNRQTDPGNI
jgi:hypothetical protein